MPVYDPKRGKEVLTWAEEVELQRLAVERVLARGTIKVERWDPEIHMGSDCQCCDEGQEPRAVITLGMKTENRIPLRLCDQCLNEWYIRIPHQATTEEWYPDD